MAAKVQLPWGGGTLDVTLPERWKLLGELRPREVPTAPDPAAACAEALKSPVDAAPLSSRRLAGKRVLLVADDHSRPTPVREFIAPVLAELAAAGATDDAIEILFATGIHRACTEEEVERKIGRDAMGRFRWRSHDAYDPAQNADYGTTARGTKLVMNKALGAADLVVCLGAIEPHLLLGFGGGLKMLLPGCASSETIGQNHLQGVDPDHFDYVGACADVSPMRLDLEEGARKAAKDVFIVNATMSVHGRPTRFFCGDPVAAHRAATAFVEGFARVEVPERSDVVLANSYPMDSDLRQSIKCVGNSLFASKPGGVMLGCVRCEGGFGDMRFPKKTLPYPLLRTVVRAIGKKRILPLVRKARKGEPVEEIFVGHFGLQMLRRNHLGVFSQRLPPDVGKRMGMVRSFTDAGEMIGWAAGKAPRDATVWVFPFGGATYAPVTNAATPT